MREEQKLREQGSNIHPDDVSPVKRDLGNCNFKSRDHSRSGVTRLEPNPPSSGGLGKSEPKEKPD